jgi:hypothetical protein
MLQEHERRRRMPHVFDAVFDPEEGAIKACADAPGERQVYPKDAGLSNGTFNPDRIIIPIPFATPTDVPGWDGGDPPVLPKFFPIILYMGCRPGSIRTG